MRSHSVLYVDAGYLIAAAATRLTGTSFRRGVKVDYAALVEALIAQVETSAKLPLLRVYWYDAARGGRPDQEQEHIAALSRVKLRLGRLGVEGEQKGVDLRIGLDMVGHARNGAIDAIYLLSGDDDLTEAVEEAQAQGVQVTVLAVPGAAGAPHGVSQHLRRASDDLVLLDGEILDATVSAVRATTEGEARAARVPNPADIARRPASVPVAMSAAPMPVPVVAAPSPVYSSGLGAKPFIAPEFQHDPEEVERRVREVVQRTYDAWAATAAPSQVADLKAGRPTIPRDVDRALLVDLSDALGDYYLSDDVRVILRAQFWQVVDDA
ncbi:MAG: NYN domain-containing protein [Microbacterium sp.]